MSRLIHRPRYTGSVWSVIDDTEQRTLLLKLPEFVSTELVRAAVSELVQKLFQRNDPSIVIADLHAVRAFDVTAPIVAAATALPAIRKFEHLRIIVGSKRVRIAAVSAAR